MVGQKGNRASSTEDKKRLDMENSVVKELWSSKAILHWAATQLTEARSRSGP